MKKYYTVYKITNLINGHIYIGFHCTKNPYDSYYGSSKTLKEDIRKLGKTYFKKEILFVFDNPDDMIQKEMELVNKEFVQREDTYNKSCGGDGFAHINLQHKEEHRSKISESHKGKKHTDETKELIKEKRKTQIMSKESLCQE